MVHALKHTPLSSSNSFEGGLTELPAQEEFKNSCRGCVCALLFSKAKDGKDLSGRSPSPRETAHLSAFCLHCNAASAGGRGVFPFPAGNKSLEGKFCWHSALLLPFINEPINVFLSAQSVSANAGELRTRGGPLPAHPGATEQPCCVQKRRAAFRAHAPARRGSPIVRLSQVSVCSSAAAPSQPITGGHALSSASGMNPPPQPMLKLMLRMKSGYTVPSPG